MMSDALSRFSEYLSNGGSLEFFAMLLGIWSVWLATKNKIAVFPTGLLSTAIYSYIFLSEHLYAFGVLNIYFCIMSLIGWYNWSQNENEQPKYPISWCDRKELIWTLGIFIMITLTSIIILQRTDDTMPLSDGLSANLQVLGMWWMTRRKIESWVAYALANIIALPLCISSELYFTAFQYFIFLILAIIGLRDWVRASRKMPQRSSPTT